MSEARVVYTNHAGETRIRRIQPKRIYHGATTWHPVPQWLLDATDLDKGQHRTFAMAGVRAWLPPDTGVGAKVETVPPPGVPGVGAEPCPKPPVPEYLHGLREAQRR